MTELERLLSEQLERQAREHAQQLKQLANVQQQQALHIKALSERVELLIQLLQN